MRYLSAFTILLFLTSILDASYLRSIRIKSLRNDSDAIKALVKLNKFVEKNDRLVKLKASHNFEFKIIKINGYNVVVAEPLRDKKLVQELLDILHTKYKDAYPRKIEEIKKPKNKIVENQKIKEEKKLPLAVKPKVVKEKVPLAVKPKIEEKKVPLPTKLEVTKEKITPPPVKLKVQEKVEFTPVKLDTKKKNEQVLAVEKKAEKKKVEIVQNIKKEEPVKTLQKKKSEKLKKEESSSNYLWEILFGLTFILLLYFIKQLMNANRKIETYINNEMINDGKILQLKEDLKSKDTLVSHVSHELRTPMTAIMGLSHLVLESELTKLQKENIQRIEHSAQHLLSLINDILDVSKLQAGELKIEKSEFNINDIIDYVLNIISVQAKDNNIKLGLDIENDVPSRVIGDSLRLGQVLINILGNAVKFTKDGEISLKIKKLSNISDSLILEFAVSDTGIGMTDTQIEKIFNSYSQAEGSTSREFGGTGLGLSITKQLIEMMNGSIKVKSQKGIGTTFTFTIQFKLKDAENKRQYRLPSASFLNKRVLVVDRSNQNVIAIGKSLGYFKYQIHSIPSFEEAVFDKNIKFDIVIIHENRLSKLAIDKVNEMKIDTDVKLVVLNEFYYGLTKQVSEDIKIDAYLRVPFTQQSMLNMIIELYVVKNINIGSRKQSIKEKLKEMAGKKILVAEDNEVNHKVISGLLAKTGIELTFVTNGKEALDLIQKNIHFDMLIMDINMPIMDGFEATKEIRKHEKYNTLPIIALSADVMDEAIRKAHNAGMQGHLPKPIIVDIFYKRVYETLLKTDVDIVNSRSVSKSIEHNEEYEELSTETGLGRCNNDVEFYKSILKDFKVMYADSASALENLCKESHFSEARRMAMDIKDVALNLGAYNLYENTGTMEYEFEKGSRSNYKALIKLYNISFEKLCADIDKYLEKV
jgi:signal transduction histidine kinase/CheY-like chemotaxis protein